MKLTRLKGRRGNKWKKGHSCITNPSVTKYRDAAKSQFFKKIEGESSLTQQALEKHNAAFSQLSEEMQKFDIAEDDLKSCGKTFATNFTSCSIPAFEKFFQTFDEKSEQHTRMLAIHAASQEYMKEQNLPETPTSYFCSLMVCLEGVKADTNDVVACLSLIVKVIRHVPVDILKAKFSYFAKLLDDVLECYYDSSHSLLLRNAIGCLSVLLRAQTREQWTASYTLNLLQKLLSFLVHDKPKIRKSAQYNISAVLRASHFIAEEYNKESSNNSEVHPGASMVAEYLEKQLRDASEMGSIKGLLHQLVFSRQVIMTLPKKQLKSLCECFLSVMQIGSALINCSSMHALHSLFESKPSESRLPAKTNIALINVLTNASSGNTGRIVIAVPSMNDSQVCIAWISVITSAIKNLCRIDKDNGYKYMKMWFNILVPYWGSDHSSVKDAVSDSLEELIEEVIENENKDILEQHRKHIQAMISTVEQALSFQYQSAWYHIFLTLSSCFKVLGKMFSEDFNGIIETLTLLLLNPEVPCAQELERALGVAIRSFGPARVLSFVPVQVTGDLVEDEKTFWMLPLLKKFVSNASLVYFKNYFVYLASKCFVLINSFKEKGKINGLIPKTYKTVETQIWALLPSFAKDATDTEEAMSNEKFARLLCDHIKFRDDTRVDVMAALRNMINSNLNCPGHLAVYSKNYLPALFNIYLCKPCGAKDNENEQVVEKGQRLAAYSTVETYVKIVPKEKCVEFVDIFLCKLSKESSAYKRRCLLDLLRTFIPYVDMPQIDKIYTVLVPILTNTSSEKKLIETEMKAAYKVLEAILCCSDEINCTFLSSNLESLSDIILKSLSSATMNAKAPRLRCIGIVMQSLSFSLNKSKREKFLQQVVSEAVLCCGGSNSQSIKKSAFLLLSQLGGKVQELKKSSSSETVRHCLKYLLAGLVGSSYMISCTTLAIASLMFQYRDVIPDDVMDLLAQNTCTLLLSPSREIVSSNLSFVKAFLKAFPPPRISNYVNNFVNSLCNMTSDCKRHFRVKTRDIFTILCRKFGWDRIRALIPDDDTVLCKRLKNLCKIEARKKRVIDKEQKNEVNSENSDGDDEVDRGKEVVSLDKILEEIDAEIEDEDIVKNVKRKKKKLAKRKEYKTYIKEEEDHIVDLLDPSAGQSVVSECPVLRAARQLKKNNDKADKGFPVDPVTGKLIITELEEKQSQIHKRLESIGEIDEMLDMKAQAAEGKMKNKKRKRTESGNSENSDDLALQAASTSRPRKVQSKFKKLAYGQEYKSKKAGGDMMLKDKREPYAYVQFNRQTLNPRKRAKFAGQFKNLVKGAKRGAASGSKKKRKK